MSLVTAPLASEEMIQTRELVVHGTTIGSGGRFPDAFQGQVFRTTSRFFFLSPREEATASVFAHTKPITGTPAILTLRNVDQVQTTSLEANLHGHVSFPEGTWLRIEGIKAATFPDPDEKVFISSHSSLNGWL